MTTSSITKKKLLLCILLVVSSFCLPAHANHSSPSLIGCKLDRIYNLGDSISDAGNLIREPAGAYTPCARLPYGQTHFKEATGRCSNGLLMIDFIAWAAGLSVLNPYKNVKADFSNGANFAVAGSTALSTRTLAKENIVSPVTNSSLEVQLQWMTKHFASLCKNVSDCRKLLKNSLFMVGEIGGNDVNYALLQGKTIDQVKSLVPNIVQGIIKATRRVIKFGARKVVIPGNFPIGCFPIYLTAFKTNDSAAYDDQNCLKDLNSLAEYQNERLQEAMRKLNDENHNTTTVYGDYYNAFKWLYTLAPTLGFDATSLQKACCGSGGDYNFNMMQLCGTQNITACPNPARFISWDGIHLSQEAYKLMAAWLIKNNLSDFNCDS